MLTVLLNTFTEMTMKPRTPRKHLRPRFPEEQGFFELSLSWEASSSHPPRDAFQTWGFPFYVCRRNLLQPDAQQLERVQCDVYGSYVCRRKILRREVGLVELSPSLTYRRNSASVLIRGKRSSIQKWWSTVKETPRR